MMGPNKWMSSRLEREENRVLDFCARKKSRKAKGKLRNNNSILRESEGLIANKTSARRNPFVSNRSSFNEIFSGTFSHKRRSRVSTTIYNY